MTFKGSDILPANATTLERVLADLDWARLDALDIAVIRKVVDPDTCPAELLPWLAWSFSVDTWDTNWTEATKRSVIAAAPEVHRLKGTRKAVRLALEALGIDIDITEWWEEGTPERRGTFKVVAWSDGVGPAFDLTLIKQLREAIRGSKPKSRAGQLIVGLRGTGSVFGGGSGQVRAVSEQHVDHHPEDGLSIDFMAGFYKLEAA